MLFVFQRPDPHGQDGNGEGPGLSGTRRKRTPDGDANGEGEGDTGGDEDDAAAAGQPMEVVGPEGSGQEEAAEVAGAATASAAAVREGMDVDEDGVGEDQHGVKNGSAETRDGGSKPEPSPGRAPAHTAGDSGSGDPQPDAVEGNDGADKEDADIGVVEDGEKGGAEEAAATDGGADNVDAAQTGGINK